MNNEPLEREPMNNEPLEREPIAVCGLAWKRYSRQTPLRDVAPALNGRASLAGCGHAERASSVPSGRVHRVVSPNQKPTGCPPAANGFMESNVTASQVGLSSLGGPEGREGNWPRFRPGPSRKHWRRKPAMMKYQCHMRDELGPPLHRDAQQKAARPACCRQGGYCNHGLLPSIYWRNNHTKWDSSLQERTWLFHFTNACSDGSPN